MNTRYIGSLEGSIIKSGHLIDNKYFVQRKVISGSQASIYEVINLEDGESYIMKAFDRKEQERLLKKDGKSFLMSEIRIHSMMKHPNIIGMIEHIEDEYFFYIILEKAEGDLLTLVQELESLNERAAARYFIPIVYAVQYCHLRGVIHRDIKLENVLITHDHQVKLCDFGLSTDKLKSDEFVGTLTCLAPEVLKINFNLTSKRYYDEKVDIWALGIILHELLYGYNPFEPENKRDFKEKEDQHKQIANNILYNKLDFSNNKELSPDLKDLLTNLLEKDPQKRFGFFELIEHPWINQSHPYVTPPTQKKRRNSTIFS